MKLQKVEKLDKKVISSIKIYMRPFNSVILFDIHILCHMTSTSNYRTIFFL